MEPKKKSYFARVDRTEPIVAMEDENAHLWAISYSDFLMALLSFFILFFSIEGAGGKQSQLVLDIANRFSKPLPGQKAGVTGTKSGSSSNEPARLPAEFADIFKNLNVKASIEKETVVISFPDDFFESGRYSIKGAHQQTIQSVLEKLKPFQTRVDLYFEGHTDDQPLHVKIQNIVMDNFLLSSLRASAALFEARQMGFDEKNMFIQASSSNLRNSRSLSLRIEPRRGTL